MSKSQLVPIESRSGVTIYGKVINNMGKLGQFEVHSDFTRSDDMVYNQYVDAEKKMIALVGVQSN